MAPYRRRGAIMWYLIDNILQTPYRGHNIREIKNSRKFLLVPKCSYAQDAALFVCKTGQNGTAIHHKVNHYHTVIWL